MGNQCFVSRGLNHEMQVSGSHRGAPRYVQQLAYWTISRDGIGLSHNGFEIIISVFIRVQRASGLSMLEIRLLYIVKTFVIGLPHINLGIGNRFTFWTSNDTGNMAWLADCTIGDVFA